MGHSKPRRPGAAKARAQGLGRLPKSQQMARVRSRDTQPEKLVRHLLSKLGVRYRLHRNDLPGRPDVYVGRLRMAIFINGCFWHSHDCRRGKRPRTNAGFWNRKIDKNVARDRESVEHLKHMGIRTLTLWTCQAASFSATCRRVARRYEEART